MVCSCNVGLFLVNLQVASGSLFSPVAVFRLQAQAGRVSMNEQSVILILSLEQWKRLSLTLCFHHDSPGSRLHSVDPGQ